MDHVDGCCHMGNGSGGQDPVAQIEDVAWTAAGPAQNIFDAPFDFM